MGRDGLSNLKNEDIVSYVLGTSYTNFEQFPIKWCLGRNSLTKIVPFYYNKSGNLCLRVPPEVPFYWKLFKIGMTSAKDIIKMSSFFKFEGPPLPVFRAVL